MTLRFYPKAIKKSSLFVNKISPVVHGLSPAENISQGEVGKVLRARPITTTHLHLPEGISVSLTHFNKASFNNKLEC